jgi:hypothetical protein
MTTRLLRHCEVRSNPEGKVFLAGAIQKKELYCARHDFVILLYWIASSLAMTPEARRYCAKQSDPGESAKSRRAEAIRKEKFFLPERFRRLNLSAHGMSL